MSNFFNLSYTTVIFSLGHKTFIYFSTVDMMLLEYQTFCRGAAIAAIYCMKEGVGQLPVARSNRVLISYSFKTTKIFHQMISTVQNPFKEIPEAVPEISCC